MDRKNCLFNKDAGKYSDCTHPLHLYSDKVKWMSAFGKCNSPCIASLGNKRNAYHSYKNQLFVVVHLDHYPNACSIEDDVESAVDEAIVLLSSSEFLTHYSIDEDERSLVIAPTSVFPLSRVVLSAKTEDSFTWANSLSFERGLMVTGSSQKKLLVRREDWFLGKPEKIFGEDLQAVLNYFRNLTVVECYPVKQGYIHSNTEVIITCNDGVTLVQEDSSMIQGELKIQILYDQYHNDNIPCDFDSDLADRLKIKDHQIVALEAFMMSNDTHGTYTELESDTSDELEEGCFVFDNLPSVVDHAMAPKLSAICRLRVGGSASRNVFNQNLQSLHPSTFYIGPTLACNCNCDPTFFNSASDIRVKIAVLEEKEVPLAKEIHLALIRSPEYSPNAEFDQTLVTYLGISRILKKNDVIAINTSDSISFMCETNIKDAGCKTLYYKVKRFGEEDENSASLYFQVNVNHTALFQDGSTNSYVPKLSIFRSLASGIRKYVNEVKELIFPYLVADRGDSSVGTILISGPPGCGKKSVVSAAASMLGLHVLSVSCHELISGTSAATEAKIASVFTRATVYSPCVFVLDGIECLGKDEETGQADHRVCSAFQQALDSLHIEKYPVVVVAVTSLLSSVVSKLRLQFLHKLEMSSLTELERKEALVGLSKMAEFGEDVNLQWIAKHTVGFTYGEFWSLFRIVVSLAIERVKDECAIGNRLTWSDEMSICAAGISIQQCDFVNALKEMQSQRADIIGVPKIPDVKWDDIGGLEEVKATIQDTIQLPLEHPELVAAGLRRSGILLYGPPGTGKTLLAKAVATQCSLSFLSVKGPELINMYVGQSEENVRKVFSRAREAAPCVVFFDELDSLAPNRGKSGDSGGVMDRVVSQLLAELDGLVEGDAEKQIFVIGASNRPDLIDPALLRPGRFDKLLYVGINVDKRDQLKILEAQTRRANLSDDVRFDEIIEQCPTNMTGADFYALTTAAMMNAIRRQIEVLEESDRALGLSEGNQKLLVVEQTDFLKAAENISPSVSKDEISRYLLIKNNITSK